MPISHAQAQLRGRIGGLTRAAKAADPRETTRAARSAQNQQYLDEVPASVTDPAERQRRADMLLRAHMSRIALKSVTARAKAKRLREQAAALELDATGLEDAGSDGVDLDG